MKIKKWFGIILSFVLIFAFSTTAFASSIILNGNDLNASNKNIAVALYSSDADMNNIKATDIIHIDQVKVDENGNWTFRIPVDYANLANVNIVSNADSYTTIDSAAPIYLSANGNDAADGRTQSTAVKTLEKALELVEDGTIYVSGTIKPDADFVWSKTNKSIKIAGEDTSAILDISNISSFSIGCDTVFENLTITMADDGNGNSSNIIFAEGNHVIVKDTVSMNKFATIYAGSESETIESTNLELYGGKYLKVFASSLNHEVTGDCNLIVGGTANKEHTIAEFSSDVPTVFSGGWNCVIGGDCIVTLKDNIKFTEVYGGSQGGKGNIVGDSIINISGGEYMNIHGCYNNIETEKSNTIITMTGGKTEAIFGGGKWMVYGDISMYLLGGTVTRRVYGGCYNNYTGVWKSDNYVKGNIGVVIGKDMNLPLNYDNNRGIFGGSRTQSNHSDEISTIVFLDNTYPILKDKVGDISGWNSTLKSHHDYIVSAGENGSVETAYEQGNNTIKIIPDKNYKAVVDDKDYSADCHTLTSVVTEIDFEKIVGFNDVNMEYLSGNAAFTVDASLPDEKCSIIVAIYDNDKMLGASVNDSDDLEDISINCVLESQKIYTIKAFMWKDMESLIPLSEFYFKTITHN